MRTNGADILVVDDEADIRDLVSGLLEDEGHAVRTASNSDEALAAIRARKPSLAVLDIWMQGGGLDGLELLDVIQGIDPDLLRTADRVVILGADAQVEPVEGMKATIERWETDEPSLRGIEGTARMNIIRDDIDARVGALASELGVEQRPSVMFVCVHNAGRSQMAAAYAHHLSGGVVEVRSAGSAPAETINPAVREALLEEGIDISAEKPKVLTDQAVRASDVVITMGCGDTCPFYPGKRYEDWVLEDPAGQGVDAVRPIRDDIKRRVTELLASLDVPVQPLPGDR